jgi:hypothetical protein
MTSRVPIVPLPFPPITYEARYFNETIRTLNLYFRTIQNPGPLIATTLQLTNLPTSATGLPIGAVWRDTSDNTLKIIPDPNGLIILVGESTTVSAGTVTP